MKADSAGSRQTLSAWGTRHGNCCSLRDVQPGRNKRGKHKKTRGPVQPDLRRLRPPRCCVYRSMPEAAVAAQLLLPCWTTNQSATCLHILRIINQKADAGADMGTYSSRPAVNAGIKTDKETQNK